jgi:hypothetical protein
MTIISTAAVIFLFFLRAPTIAESNNLRERVSSVVQPIPEMLTPDSITEEEQLIPLD